MSFTLFDIYFSGQIIEGNDPDQVKQKIAQMFKADAAQVERMFSGKPIRIKSGVDQDTAIKYRGAFKNAGALIDIKPAGKEAQEQGPESMSLLPPRTGSLEECQVPVKPAPIPDISNLDLSPPGTIVDEHEPLPQAEIDTSSLSLDPEGVTIDESEPVPDADINTDDLDLNPPKTGSLEDAHTEPEPAVIPDVSALHLEEDDDDPRFSGED
ncbi:hypothetical protein [Solemya velesiana gill symbiont]|uniref:Uncharacterized protein n=1 Tax=Solemya velesiana gill symbiont TaxID=1918948 RepID=A0A1T2KYA5_9GAMM|nr:hypothetical protein [Solemya velesiana gill symbiont]OOZ37740.1 hypothetical protein BOW51_01000 [Solemya velesiana gill symbiont]